MSEATATVRTTTGPIDVALDDEGRIAVDLACRRCSFNLRGRPADGSCPECSTPVGLLGPIAFATTDDGCVAEDVACRRCGYNLLGQKTDAVCPECATPVARSLRSSCLVSR